LTARIGQRMNRKVPLSAILQGATVEALAGLLQRSPSEWSPLVEIQPGSGGSPLYCIHPLGGNVVCYAELARRLGTEQPVYGLQACGFEEGQTPIISLDEMAALYVAALRNQQQHGPY